LTPEIYKPMCTPRIQSVAAQPWEVQLQKVIFQLYLTVISTKQLFLLTSTEFIIF